MKAISVVIAEACVRSVIESFVQSILVATLPNGNAQARPGKISAMGIEWTVTYKSNSSGPNQRKLEDGLKQPLVLTKEFSGLQPRQPGKPRKDVAAERWNRFALWREAWRCMWRDACW